VSIYRTAINFKFFLITIIFYQRYRLNLQYRWEKLYYEGTRLKSNKN